MRENEEGLSAKLSVVFSLAAVVGIHGDDGAGGGNVRCAGASRPTNTCIRSYKPPRDIPKGWQRSATPKQRRRLRQSSGGGKE